MDRKSLVGAIREVATLINEVSGGAVSVKVAGDKPSVVGRTMIVGSDAHAKSLSTNASADVRGCVVEILTEPYAKKVDVLFGTAVFEFVKVRSLTTSREYEVLFTERWLFDEE